MTLLETRALGRWRGHTVTVATSFRDRSKVILKPLDGEPAPDGFAKIPGTAGVGLEVSPAELDEWWSTRTFCTWRGKRFMVTARDGDTLSATLYDVDDAWARENGLTVQERGVAQGRFAVSDVDDLHEQRTDLLAKWRERTRRA